MLWNPHKPIFRTKNPTKKGPKQRALFGPYSVFTVIGPNMSNWAHISRMGVIGLGRYELIWVVDCCTLFLCYLGTDDHHRNPNSNTEIIQLGN